LTGYETFTISGLSTAIEGDFSPGQRIAVSAETLGGKPKTFEALLRVDTPNEAQYYRHGGILQYVLRGLLAKRT
jgi:aconitate hydratase